MYDLRDDIDYLKYHKDSPLLSWCLFHCSETVNRIAKMDTLSLPHTYSFTLGNRHVKLVIDEQNKFEITDQWSQIHCMQQAQHVSSYPFLQKMIESGDLSVNALWFDIHSGNVFMFSDVEHRFVVIEEENVDSLIKQYAETSLKQVKSG